MNVRRYPLLREAIDQLKSRGAEDVEPTYGGKHFKIKFKLHNQSLMYAVPMTTGDQKSWLAQKTQINRMVREAGERAARKAVPA